jgi:hypothetical protein
VRPPLQISRRKAANNTILQNLHNALHHVCFRISGGHVVVREYLALRFLNDCSEFSYTRLVLLETEKSSNLAASKSKAPRTPVVSDEVS